MNILNKLSIKNLKLNKKRTISTIIGIRDTKGEGAFFILSSLMLYIILVCKDITKWSKFLALWNEAIKISISLYILGT